MTDPVRFGARVSPGGPFECGFQSAKGAAVIGTNEPNLFTFLIMSRYGFSTYRGYAGRPLASHKDFQSALTAGLERPKDHVILRQGGNCFVTYRVKRRAPFTFGPKEFNKKLVDESDSWLLGQSEKLDKIDGEVAAFVDGKHDKPDAAPEDRVVVVEHRTKSRP